MLKKRPRGRPKGGEKVRVVLKLRPETDEVLHVAAARESITKSEFVERAIAERLLQIMDGLTGHRLSKEQEDYLEAISLFVDEYERRNVYAPKMEPLELLKHLLKENGLYRIDLAEILGLNVSNATRILKGTRAITVAHATRLGERFNVRSALFLPRALST